MCSCILNLFIFILYLEEFYDGMKNPVNKPNEDRTHMETKFFAETLPSSIPLSTAVSRADHKAYSYPRQNQPQFSINFLLFSFVIYCQRWSDDGEISEKYVSKAVNRK